jgi:hypothetical protein
LFYATASATALYTFYFVNKNSSFPDHNSHHALSFFSKPNQIDLSDALTNSITDEKVLRERSDVMRYQMEAYITNLQGQIIKQLQELEPNAKFKVDRWMREEGGGGITCILEGTMKFKYSVFLKAIINSIIKYFFRGKCFRKRR